ncbi:hypothetical protein An12g05530 [Aspergillus niger]|uniref:Uncharacterized protein n=2 Tax=Aspergillus niger TaxID=5061 RepID=A2QZN1_ASPNC|nr:hypothetical protein An12g05530 [Aspergillus niger]CAK46263.1 hypothetical protein An12g05530 [Aspergillus niger]
MTAYEVAYGTPSFERAILQLSRIVRTLAVVREGVGGAGLEKAPGISTLTVPPLNSTIEGFKYTKRGCKMLGRELGSTAEVASIRNGMQRACAWAPNLSHEGSSTGVCVPVPDPSVNTWEISGVSQPINPWPCVKAPVSDSRLVV